MMGLGGTKWMFSAHIIKVYTWTRGMFCHPSEPHLGKVLLYLQGLGLGVFDMTMPMSNRTHLLRILLACFRAQIPS